MKRILPVLLACLALAACSSPPPTPETDPPEPQAAAGGGDTALRQAIEEPLDKARTVEDAQAERNAERDQALEDAGG